MKHFTACILSLLLLFAFAACQTPSGNSPSTTSTAVPESTAVPTEAAAVRETDTPTPSAQVPAETETPAAPIDVRVASLKGPTSMGLVNLMKRAENEDTVDGLSLSFRMETDASAVAALVVSGDTDIALIPANLAAVLYNRTNGGISVLDINTLGVLYCITGDESIGSITDLAQKTIVMTGQGTTPEYALRHLMEANGITEYEIEFKSEATEVAAVLSADPSHIAILPQPFATVAMVQNSALKEAFSLTDEWASLNDGSQLVTGVTVVRNDFLAEHPEAIQTFLSLHAASADEANADVEGTAALVAEYGIIEKAPVAQKALPKCAIVCISGNEMKSALSGYLNVLFAADPSSVGGTLPADTFYYAAQ